MLTSNPLEESAYRREHGLHDRADRRYRALEKFRDQQRDLYIAASDIGYWQAAFRDSGDELRRGLATTIADREPFSVDLLYGDHEGGQHEISRFNLVPEENSSWFCTVVFHWTLDGVDPRGAQASRELRRSPG